MFKRTVSVLLIIGLLVGVFAIVPISASAESPYVVSYHVAPYVFHNIPDGFAYAIIDGSTYNYSDDFDSGNIASALPQLKNKNVVYELHNSEIVKVYAINEVIYPKITVCHSDTEELYFKDGKFNRSSFELQIKITPQLSEQFLDDDLLWFLSDDEIDRLYLNLEELNISTPYGADFGSSGFWLWQSYTDEVNENYDDDIKVNETKIYSYTIYLRDDKVLNQTEYTMDFNVTPKFDFGAASTKTAKIQISNLDEYAAIAEAKKESSPSGKAEKATAQALSLNGNLVTVSTTWNNFFTNEQSRQLDEFAYVWVSDLILAEIIDYSQFDLQAELAKRVQQEVLNKLGIDEKIITTGEELTGSVNLITETKDGDEVLVNYVADLSSFKFGLFSDKPFGVTGQLKLSVYKISDGSQMGMTETVVVNYSDVDTFIENLQAIAKSTIFNIGKDVYGLSAKKAANAITDGLMTKALNSKSECFSVVSRLSSKQKNVVKKVASKVIGGELKKCNETVFKLLTTPSKSAKLHRFECPVNVRVYDNAGNYCGGIMNNQVDAFYHEVFATVNGESMDFYTIGDDYYFIVTGYDTGTMKYTVKEFDSDGEIRKLSYEDVPIENGCMYYSMSPQAENLSNIYFDLVDDKGNVISPTKGADNSYSVLDNENVLESGKCGENVDYILYKDGLLEIYGTGEMKTYYEEAPWYNNCSIIKKVLIDNGITKIGTCAFYNCKNLEEVSIGNDIIEIGGGAFWNCTSLTSVTIPPKVNSIDNLAFYLCSDLERIEIPKSVSQIGHNAFEGCSNLSGVYIEDISAWCDIDFEYSGGLNVNMFYYFGSNPLYYAQNLYLNNELVTNLIIPNGVKHIKTYAFYGCKCVTNITIPNSIVDIGGGAFCGCTNLTSVYINDIAAWCKISFGNDASNPLVYAHNLFLNNELVTELIIPNLVASIGEWAFDGCTSIISTTISNSVTSIGEYAFYYCSNLKSIAIPDSVKSIGERAFLGCSCVEYVNTGNGITSLNGFYFSNNTNLKNVIIGNSVTSIANAKFLGCSGLSSITIPLSVESIGESAFWNCNSLEDIYYAGSESQWNSIVIGKDNDCLLNATIHYGSTDQISPTGITLNKNSLSLIVGESETLVATVSPGNTTDKSVTWSSSNTNVATVSNGTVTAKSSGTAEISAKTSNGLIATCTVNVVSNTGGNNNCTWSLDDEGTLVVTGQGVIEDNAFKGRTDIKNVVIGDGVTGIGEYAFYNCTNIESVTIGEGVKSIGYRAFLQCYSLCSVSIGKNVTVIEDSAFYYCNHLSIVTIPDSVKKIGNYAFYHCVMLDNISVSENIVQFGSEVFYNTAFYNNDSSWENNALYLNKYLVHVKDSISGSYQIKSGTICIADRVFGNCESLTEVIVPNSVLYLGNWTFDKCINLKKIKLGTSVKSIGYDTFSECTSLESISIPNSVTSIGNFAFSCCESLTSIVVPDSVTSIGERAFYYCSGMESITIGNGITNISYRTFEECTSLVNVTLGNSIQTLGEEAFRKCSSIKNIVIPDSVLTVGKGAFYYCTSLENVKIGKHTQLIDKYAFWGCDSLFSVTISDSVTEIGYGAFGNTTNLTDVYYDGSESQWNSIVIGDNNEYLLAANIHFNTDVDIIANGKCGDNLSWSLDSEGILSISGTGDMYDYSILSSDNNYAPWKEYGEQIESVVINEGVTSIGAHAFQDYGKYNNRSDLDSIKEVSLPSTLLHIGEGAFLWCNSLKSITIPDSVTSIDKEAFARCKALSNVVLSSSLSEISEGVFEYCESLKTIDFPESIKSLGDFSLSGAGIENIIIPNSITELCPYSLSSISLKTVIVEGDIVVDFYVFSGSQNLETAVFYGSITFNEKSNHQPGALFNNCSSLKYLTIPSVFNYNGEDLPVQSYGNFYGCDSLEISNITFNDNPTIIDNVVFSSDGKTLLWYHKKLKSTNYAVPNGVKKIAYQAFMNNEYIEHIILPDTLLSLGVCTFMGCKKLNNVIIPDGVESLLDFQGCTSLDNIVIPSSVTTLYNNGKADQVTFQGIDELTVYCDNDSYARSFLSYYDTKDIVYCTFDANGGTVAKSKQAVIPSDKYWTLPSATKENAVFDGWYTSKTGGTRIDENSTVNSESSFTLYAHWINNDPTDKATVTIEGLFGQSETREFNVGDEFTVYTTLNCNEIDGGYIGSLKGYQYYTESILENIDEKEVRSVGTYFKNLDEVFPTNIDITGNNQTTANAGISGKIVYTASTSKLGEQAFLYNKYDSLLIVTKYRVVSSGEASVTNSLNTLTLADNKMTKVVNGGEILNDNFTLNSYFDYPTISTKSIESATITLSQTLYTYDGTAKEPAVTVKDGNKTLTSGTDYIVSYSGNINAGTATVTVTGKGNYTGSSSKSFTINAKSISSTTVTLSQSSYTYDGTAKEPSFTVKDGSKTLMSGTDYTVSYSGNINAGTATVTITGKGNYTGSSSKSFTINAKSISSTTVTLSQSSYTYDGTAKEPAVTVKDGNKTLTSGTDYTVSYSGNINAGTATVTVTGKGNYTGSSSKSFTIAPNHDNPQDNVFLGDVDGDGEVSVIDATYIQRFEAGFTIPVSEEYMLRCGDIDGDEEVGVIDATYIQRYNAGFNTPYHIGELL